MLACWKESYDKPRQCIKKQTSVDVWQKLTQYCKAIIHQLKINIFLSKKKKCRDITLPVKVHIGKAMVFLVVMYGCKIWTIKKAGHQRIDAFEL